MPVTEATGLGKRQREDSDDEMGEVRYMLGLHRLKSARF